MEWNLRAAVLTVLLCGGIAKGGVIFEDGFEAGLSSDRWSTAATWDGRVAVSSDSGAATGNKHLVLDDKVTDTYYSVSEAILKQDLTNKQNVVLQFKAKSLGNEPHEPPTANFTTARNYDGVAVSADGGTTWKSVQTLANVGEEWETFVVPLDPALTSLGGRYRENFLIRFSAYDNSPVPLDGLAIDDVQISGDDDQRLVLELPSTIHEGGGPYTGHAVLGFPSTQPITISFSTNSPGQILLPSSVTIPAGEAYTSFTFSAAEDTLINLTRTVTVTPIPPSGVVAMATMVKIRDNETPPTATLVLPTSVTEEVSYSNNASISINVPASVPIAFSLSGSPNGEISTPATVTINAGQTQALFTVQAVNDVVLDGNRTISLTAAAANLVPAISQTVAIDNEVPALSWTLPTSMVEGTTGTGAVALSSPLAVNLEVFLGSSASGTLAVPAKVTIPAGQLAVEVTLAAGNDTLVNFGRTVTLTAIAPGVTTSTKSLTVSDDETPPALAVTVPAELTEGSAAGSGTVSLSFAAGTNVTVSFSAVPSGEISMPSSVTVPAGQTSATFSISAVNDTRIDGNIATTVNATASGLAPATTQTVSVDNDARILTFTLPATMLEGATATGTVKIPGSLPSPLVITLSGPPSGTMAIPTSVTIPAGQTQATFTMVATANNLKDGSRTVGLMADTAGFTTASGTLIVRDDDIAGYTFSSLTDVMLAGAPVSVTLTASDVEGNPIPGVVSSVNLSIVLPDGTTQPLAPSSAIVSGTAGWSGSVTIPAVGGSPLKLRATDGNGTSGESSPFDLMHALALKAEDILWDKNRGKIYASVPASATGSYANKVVAIDPLTLQITGSVTTNQNPGQIVMTGGGEYLYVALNGNGTIAKINPTTMTVVSTFAVGVSPYYGTLYAADMCTVAGQPDLLVVSQYRKSVSPSHNGVAVYDNGVMRSVKTQDHTGSNVIEPSTDPSVFYGYCTESTEYGFRSLKLDDSGMTQTKVDGTLMSGFYQDIRSAGDMIYSNNGVVINGPLMKRAGTFPTSGLVCPDVAVSGRVFFFEQEDRYSSEYGKFSAFDPMTFTLIRRISLPSTSSPKSLIRWGANGMAFLSGDSIMLFGSSSLIPSSPPADLATTVTASPNPAATGAPLTYTVQVTNKGPNVSPSTRINAVLSSGQTLVSSDSTLGKPVVSGSNVLLDAGNLAVGATATVSLVTTPLSAGSLTCSASAASEATDPEFANNSSFKLVSVGFQAGVNSINQLRLAVNGLVADPSRNLLWATIPSTEEAPLGRSVVSINPSTGLISAPIPLNAVPASNVMALSSNGRYLYVGLSDIAEIARLDLNASPPSIVRIPLGLNGWSDAGVAADIEVLDGDGTSIIATTTGDDSALVIDGTVRRANRTSIYTVSKVERTSPGTYVGYNSNLSSYALTRLAVSPSGVSISKTVNNLLSGFSADICGSGDTLLSSTGMIVNSNELTLRAELGINGRPCLETAHKRAYLVYGSALRAFNSDTGAAAGSLTLPTTDTGDWATRLTRWGMDGFAIAGSDGKIHVIRWSDAVPSINDSNIDGIPDAWAVAHFGTQSVPSGDTDGDGIPDSLEYLFGTAPKIPSRNPMSLSKAGESGVLHLSFTRRAGVTRPAYDFQFSSDLRTWTTVPSATETVISTRTTDGASVETMDAEIPVPGTGNGFVRIIWQ